MSVLPVWADDPGALEMTEADYDVLPDELRKLIEVIDGNIIRCQSGSPEHSDVARRLANHLEAVKPQDPCTRVSTDVDVRFTRRQNRDGAFSFRRPDVTVYRCVERGTKLTTGDALLVVEVVSPGSGYTDTVDKLAEYAYEGIPVYLVVHLDASLYVKMIQEYRLDWATRVYRLVDTHQEAVTLESPFPATILFGELDG
ncbi:Uma2 family endonuclease [Nocardia brasiliensis]|uniref:Uma2 family endonuclease n=1 Tax=Nocardia brasiliensis TaxID=37326 RepID=A0A6G9XSN1_NOCBR|nr:Uma2 family endonuclease [Nocardia brasiliensis]QIS03919.1 Uma2 family endonuclease [Nocardia brasiliensis]